MPATTTRATALLAALTLAAPAAAQERPQEEELFGAPRPPAAGDAGEASGRPAAEERVRAELGRTEDPLKLGGMLYLRSTLAATDQGPPSHWGLATPALLDLYLDARPSDRVRGFALARSTYDATLARSGVPYQSRSALSGAGSAQANPRGVLDQLWVRFDVGHAVFVTAGRQHVKWGAGHLWSPNDLLHVARRDPLATFDDRAGATMLKLHVPWEERGWNFYAFAIPEALVPPPSLPGLQAGTPPPPGELGAMGGALRAEVVLGGTELGIGGVAQRGTTPRLAVDVSTGLWEIDLRGELGLRRGADLRRLVNVGGDDDPEYQLQDVRGLRGSAVLAAEWQHKYSDEDTFTLGVEGFWNQSGYSDPHLYLPVLAAQLATPFYLGRWYAGAFLRLPQPGSWNLHTFNFTALGNLSDRSFVVRMDWSVTLLTYLTLETYLGGHVGAKGGEFRFGFDRGAGDVGIGGALGLAPVCAGLGGVVTGGGVCQLPRLRQAAPAVDAGVALRLPL